ncbi:MAG: amidohydrolase family protein [Phycisphaeraceae bacterium]
MNVATDVVPKNDANRLGLDYRAEAGRLPHTGPIWDVHQHIHGLSAAKLFFEVASHYNIERVWTMTPLELVDDLKSAYGDRLQFIAVPNYNAKENPATFTTDWLRRIEGFREKGCRIVKLWAAPRGRDFSDALQLDTPTRREGIKLARELGMMFMTHVSDPDTWFATKYADSAKYGTKAQQYEPLERLLGEYGDVPWIAAHMGGDPEHLDHLQDMLDRHANLYLDTSATKWMVRELSKKPDELRDFVGRNAGRLLFGSDIVADDKDVNYDLYASRYWALRTMFETSYDGMSPIVDPDLNMVDERVPKDATPPLRGAAIEEKTLDVLYKGAAERLLSAWMD